MVETAALAAGLSWASGMRLYLAVLMAGVLARAGLLELPASLQVLQSPWVIGVAATLAAAEFVADKVPVFDSLWDAVHTFIRVPAGAILAAAAVGQMDAQWVVVAALLGGTLAGTAHAMKAGSRALLNVSPEPFSNWAASAFEDIVAPLGLLLAVFLPALFLVLVVSFVLLALWLLPRLWRGVRLVLRRLRGWLQANTAPAARP
jgi:hypothetical protein